MSNVYIYVVREEVSESKIVAIPIGTQSPRRWFSQYPMGHFNGEYSQLAEYKTLY